MVNFDSSIFFIHIIDENYSKTNRKVSRGINSYVLAKGGRAKQEDQSIVRKIGAVHKADAAVGAR